MTKTESLQTKTARVRREASTRNILLTFLLVILLPVFAAAQLPVPASSQFDVTGFIQSATLGGPGSGTGSGAHQGGFITVNGQLITVPSETIVILPANALHRPAARPQPVHENHGFAHHVFHIVR